MTKTTTRTALLATLCAALLLALSPRSATAQNVQDLVTSEGFQERIAKSTLYMHVPMGGIIGVESPAESVQAVLKTAASDKNVKHAVFMIDSYRGIPIEHEHIGTFEKDLEISAVVRNALAPAIFPVFFADNIFMIDSALVGNLPLRRYVAKGSEQVAAKQVGIYSSMLASAAQSRGHSAAVAYAMIDDKKQLYYWKQDGKPMLSNTKPTGETAIKGFEQISSGIPGRVLTLDHETAVKIGFAKSIDAFDHMVVGEYLNKKNWMPANRFGQVACEIGTIVAELEPLRNFLREWDKQFKEEDWGQGNEKKGFRDFKKSIDGAIDQIDTINDALTALYKVHPERHAYFVSEGGKTIVADPEQWNKDLQEARKEVNRAYALMRRLSEGFKNVGFDEEHLYDLNRRMQTIQKRLIGIGRYGNATYWKDHAGPDRPDDIYG